MIGLLLFCLTWLAPPVISGAVHDASGGARPRAPPGAYKKNKLAPNTRGFL